MAPLISDDIPDLGVSSLELDARSSTLDELVSRMVPSSLLKRDLSDSAYSPTEVLHMLNARDADARKKPDHAGAVDPHDINMKGLQALFAIIGASFVLAIIWFFFWAKNGGFKWRKGDWDDYKSTVLRRKGPNGTTLSNATKSTILGGGSVVGEGYSDGSGSTVDNTYSETMTVTDMSSEAPIMKQKRETAKEKKLREVNEANWEGANDNDVLAYMREKPARVGGINKDSEALHYGTDYTDTEGSQVHSNRGGRTRAERGQPPSRQASPEKRQARRDFSYGNDEAFSTVSSSQPEIPPTMPSANFTPPTAQPDIPPPTPPHRPGRYHSPNKQFTQPQYTQPANFQQSQSQYFRTNTPGAYHQGSAVSEVQNQNTKAYHHPLPSLSNQQNQNQTRGYRRDRRDSLDD